MNEQELAEIAAQAAAAHDPAAAAPAAAPAAPAGAEGEQLGALASDCYGYECEGDPLYHGGLLPGEQQVRPGPVRTTVIKPHRDPEEQARRDALRAKFIVDAKDGKKLPNSVSEKEFDQIADMYEHIWDGDRDMKIDTKGLGAESEKYKDNVMEQMGRMLQTPMGRKQLQYLTYGYKRDGKDVHHKTTIQAPEDQDHNGSRLDEYAADANPTDGMSAGFVTSGDDLHRKIVGKGSGSDSIVDFNVPNWDQGGARRADVALAHELTHSLTQIMGIEDEDRVDFSDGINKDVSGQRPLVRREHQAAGLGKYESGPLADLPINERLYVQQRNAVGQGPGIDAQGEVLPTDLSGAHQNGDDELRPRESYRP